MVIYLLGKVYCVSAEFAVLTGFLDHGSRFVLLGLGVLQPLSVPRCSGVKKAL